MRLKHACAFIVLLHAEAGVVGAQTALRLEPGVPYYVDEFDASPVPWRPAEERNYEEVFKNHEYYELVLGRDRRTLVVTRYLRDRAPERQEYLLLPSEGLGRVGGAR